MKKLCSPPIVAVLLFAGVAFGQSPNSSPPANNGAPKNSPDAAHAATAPASAGSTNSQSGITVEKLNMGDVPEDPLLEPPPLPKGKVTMVGGLVTKIDPIRSRLSIAPFGSNQKMNIFFDERSHIFSDGRATTQTAIHRGDRVYVDTMLDGSRVFARNIHVISQSGSAGATGQVLSYDPARKTVTVEDQLSATPVTLLVGPQTAIELKNGAAGSAANLAPGALVAIQFAPVSNGYRWARQIQVLAVPGELFTFTGKVTNLDLRNRVISVENQTDSKIYDIALDGAQPVNDNLQVGARVSVVATFTGRGYRATSVSLD